MNIKRIGLIILAVLLVGALNIHSTQAATAVGVSVNAGTALLTIPSEIYGMNMAVWDSSGNGSDTLYETTMAASGSREIRWPGGSWADIVDWNNITCQDASGVTIDQSISFINSFGAKFQPIVNFSGFWCNTQHTQAEAVQKAADLVTYLNKTKGLGAKYWEVGNEDFGSWEQGFTTGSDYGTRFAQFYNAMKAVDPTIKVGAVGVSDSGYNNWTVNVLTAAKAAGVVPDFLIIHDYPDSQGAGPTSDTNILNSVNQITTFTNNLNSMISSSIGSQYVGQIKYMMTEYRSELGTLQPTFYVDAMFDAQMMLEMAKAGWIGSNIWDMKNGYDSSTTGDYGVLRIGNGSSDDMPADSPRPAYYVFPFLSGKFGTSMVSASSNNSMVRAYAAKDSAGRLTLFMVNNSPNTDATVTITLTGFSPSSGEQWVFSPAGTTSSGATTPIQEVHDIAINGTVRPGPQTLANMAGQAVSVGSSFTYTLPMSDMVLLRLTSGGSTAVPPTKTNTPTAIPSTKTNTPVPTTGASPTPSKTNTPVPTSSGATNTPVTGGNGLNVLIDKGGGTDNNQETTFNFELKNTSSSAISNISARIYFTADGSNAGSGYTMEKYYDQSGVATISAPTLASGSTYYFTISFGTASLAAGGQWEFQTALHLSSWGNTYDGSNDWYHTGYAVGALPAAYTNTNYIPAYVSGSLVWGQAPGGSPAPTATPTFIPPTATKPPATSTNGPTKTNTPIPTNGPTATTAPTKTNTSVPTAGPSATSVPPTKTNTPAPTSSGSDPCASPTVITGGGTFNVTTASTCFKYVNTSFVNGGMFSVMKDATSTTDTVKWYGGMDQNATSCANQSATVSGNGGQLNNFTVAKDANGQMFLIISGTGANSVTLSIQNWQNGTGCSVKPTVHP